ncbi:MAG: hypothetical protein K6T73_01335 [Candidatus Bathyarchaeota archaeon]|nr:hypothetical protein [Candidatus Bathyarchaeota archaeon]
MDEEAKADLIEIIEREGYRVVDCHVADEEIEQTEPDEEIESIGNYDDAMKEIGTLEEYKGIPEELPVKKETNKPKKLLLNQYSLNLVTFARSDENLSHLDGIHVINEYTEATDGYILVRLTNPNLDPNEFPETPGYGFEEKINYILPKDDLKNVKPVKKSSYSILSHVCLSHENGMVLLSTTDLSSMQTVKVRPTDAQYPETENVIDNSIEDPNDKSWIKFSLDAHLLKKLCDYVSKTSKNLAPITFWVKDGESALQFKFRISETAQEGRGIIMPCRP